MLALADGVNWGARPRNAAEAAVYGSVRHVLQQLLQQYGRWGNLHRFQVLHTVEMHRS
jgi:hypothetical protein